MKNLIDYAEQKDIYNFKEEFRKIYISKLVNNKIIKAYNNEIDKFEVINNNLKTLNKNVADV